jgi:hypothetical protein
MSPFSQASERVGAERCKSHTGFLGAETELGYGDEMSESAELQEAIGEIQQYFADKLAPLMVADAMERLLQYPASLLADQVQAWIAHQQAGSAASVPASDLLFHAVKKVALMGEFNLVPVEALRNYVTELARDVLPFCPEGDRDTLAENLERLGQLKTLAGTGGGDTLHVIHRQARAAGTEPPPLANAAGKPAEATPVAAVSASAAKGFGAEVARGLKRLSLLLDRLRPHGDAPEQGAARVPVPAERRAEVTSEFVTTAVSAAKTEKELEQHLAPLREMGIEPGMDKIFRALASTLPGWGSIATGDGAQPMVGAQLNAMRQIVSLVEDPSEAARRFREMVHSAIEQFNEGYLGRAVTMFELAERLAADQKVQAAFIEPLRGGHEKLSPERLRKFVDRGDTRASLRVVMNFFTALRPEGLLDQLNGEPRRDRRHELLAMLEVHAAPARARVREMLQLSVETADSSYSDPFFQMNLVYLLRVIPRPAEVSLDEEIDLVLRATGRDVPPPLVKQVIAYVSAVRHDKCERALITYLRLFENMLLQPETTTYSPAEVGTLLDRACAGLARYGTPRSWRALVDHGLKSEVRLGSPTARLVEAGRQDLSGSPELIDRLIVALKGELPKSVLGITVKKNDERIIWLVQALSGTPTDQVRATLQDMIDRFPGTRFAEAASKSLATLGASSKPAPAVQASLSGDLELFGLPNLLQTLAQSSLTGALTILNTQGKAESLILLEKGQFRGAHYGHIKAARAVYQLFERPFPGTFAFVNRPEIASLSPNSPGRDVVGIILEGVRRHDEFKRAAALVSDELMLAATDATATPLSDEDPALARLVWDKVVAGASVQQCEATVTVDCYHVRRLLAHWVEEGALAPR